MKEVKIQKQFQNDKNDDAFKARVKVADLAGNHPEKPVGGPSLSTTIKLMNIDAAKENPLNKIM